MGIFKNYVGCEQKVQGEEQKSLLSQKICLALFKIELLLGVEPSNIIFWTIQNRY